MGDFLNGLVGSDGRDSEFVRRYDLGEVDWSARWERIYIDPTSKEKIVNYGLLEPSLHVDGFDRMTLNRHAAILLAGPPGTGKTTLAQGAGHELANRLDLEALGLEGAVFKQVEMRHLFSKRHGDSPKLVRRVFGGIMDEAREGETYQVVLLDEVESLFSNRRTLTDTDPMDAIRAVNMALDSLDELAAVDNVYVISTSNQPEVVDAAYVDRTDEQIHVGYPDPGIRRRILEDVVEHLNAAFEAGLSPAGAEMDRLVELTDGFSGRRIRKSALAALARDEATVEDPGNVTVDALLAEVEERRARAGSPDGGPQGGADGGGGGRVVPEADREP